MLKFLFVNTYRAERIVLKSGNEANLGVYEVILSDPSARKRVVRHLENIGFEVFAPMLTESCLVKIGVCRKENRLSRNLHFNNERKAVGVLNRCDEGVVRRGKHAECRSADRIDLTRVSFTKRCFHFLDYIEKPLYMNVLFSIKKPRHLFLIFLGQVGEIKNKPFDNYALGIHLVKLQKASVMVDMRMRHYPRRDYRLGIG